MRIYRIVGHVAGRCDLATHPTHSGFCLPICPLRRFVSASGAGSRWRTSISWCINQSVNACATMLGTRREST